MHHLHIRHLDGIDRRTYKCVENGIFHGLRDDNFSDSRNTDHPGSSEERSFENRLGQSERTTHRTLRNLVGAVDRALGHPF